MDFREEGDIVKTYAGKVVNLSDRSPTDWPQSPWESLGVLWDEAGGETVVGSKEVERINPWEGTPITVAESSLPTILATFTAPAIPDEVRARVLDRIVSILEEPNFEAFGQPVDQEAYPDYHSIVPVPIDLSCIERRLRNGYYRQINALIHDLDLLEKNCVLYNMDDSPIVHHAKDLVSRLKDAVRDSPSEQQEPRVKGAVEEEGDKIDELEEPDTQDLILRLNLRRSGDAEREEVRETASGHRPGEEDEDREGSGTVSISHGKDLRKRLHLSAGTEQRDCDTSETISYAVAKSTSRRKQFRIVLSPSKNLSARQPSTSTMVEEDAENEDEDEDMEEEDDDSACSEGSPRESRHRSTTHQPKKTSNDTKNQRIDRLASEALHEKASVEETFTFSRSGRARKPNKLYKSDSDQEVEEGKEYRPKRSRRNPQETTDVEQVYHKEEKQVTFTRSGRAHKPNKIFQEEENVGTKDGRARRAVSVEVMEEGEMESRRSASQASGQSRRVSSRSVPSRHTQTAPQEEDAFDVGEDDEDDDDALVEPRKLGDDMVAKLTQVRDMLKRPNRVLLRSGRPRDMRARLMALLDIVSELDSDGIFAEPVPEDIPGYYATIQNPMDLSTIRSKIDGDEYESVAALLADLFLMYDNCEEFNEEDSLFANEARFHRETVQTYFLGIES